MESIISLSNLPLQYLKCPIGEESNFFKSNYRELMGPVCQDHCQKVILDILEQCSKTYDKGQNNLTYPLATDLDPDIFKPILAVWNISLNASKPDPSDIGKNDEWSLTLSWNDINSQEHPFFGKKVALSNKDYQELVASAYEKQCQEVSEIMPDILAKCTKAYIKKNNHLTFTLATELDPDIFKPILKVWGVNLSATKLDASSFINDDEDYSDTDVDSDSEPKWSLRLGWKAVNPALRPLPLEAPEPSEDIVQALYAQRNNTGDVALQFLTHDSNEEYPVVFPMETECLHECILRTRCPNFEGLPNLVEGKKRIMLLPNCSFVKETIQAFVFYCYFGRLEENLQKFPNTCEQLYGLAIKINDPVLKNLCINPFNKILDSSNREKLNLYSLFDLAISSKHFEMIDLLSAYLIHNVKILGNNTLNKCLKTASAQDGASELLIKASQVLEKDIQRRTAKAAREQAEREKAEKANQGFLTGFVKNTLSFIKRQADL